MDPYLTITMVFFALGGFYACTTLTGNPSDKRQKNLPGVSDEKAHQEFMKIRGSAFKAGLNKLGYSGELGIMDFINKKK